MIRRDAIHLNEERITNVALAYSPDGLGRGLFELTFATSTPLLSATSRTSLSIEGVHLLISHLVVNQEESKKHLLQRP